MSAEGNYTLRVRAEDWSEHVSDRTWHFTVDRTGPTVCFINVEDGHSYLSKQPKVEVSDAVSSNEVSYSVFLQKAGEERESYDDVLITNGGDYLLSVEAVDAVGNQTMVSREFGITDQFSNTGVLFADYQTLDLLFLNYGHPNWVANRTNSFFEITSDGFALLTHSIGFPYSPGADYVLPSAFEFPAEKGTLEWNIQPFSYSQSKVFDVGGTNTLLSLSIGNSNFIQLVLEPENGTALKIGTNWYSLTNSKWFSDGFYHSLTLEYDFSAFVEIPTMSFLVDGTKIGTWELSSELQDKFKEINGIRIGFDENDDYSIWNLYHVRNFRVYEDVRQ